VTFLLIIFFANRKRKEDKLATEESRQKTLKAFQDDRKERKPLSEGFGAAEGEGMEEPNLMRQIKDQK
jgi:hypothetical protein